MTCRRPKAHAAPIPGAARSIRGQDPCKSWAAFPLKLHAPLLVAMACAAMGGCRPSAPGVRPLAHPEVWSWEGDGRQRVFFAVAQRPDRQGTLYAYESGGTLTPLAGRLAHWAYAGIDQTTGSPVLTASRGRPSCDVYLWAPGGDVRFVARAPFETVRTSPTAPMAAFIVFSGGVSVAGVLHPGDAGKRWRQTRWSWPGVRPLELYWTAAGELLVATGGGSDGLGEVALSVVDTGSGERKELLAYDGVMPFVRSPSAGNPHFAFVLASIANRTDDATEEQRLSLVDAATGTAVPLASGKLSWFVPSPTGKSVVLSRYSGTYDGLLLPGPLGPAADLRSSLCVLDVGRRVITDLTAGDSVDMPFDFLNAREIVFTRTDAGRVSIRACAVDGTGDRELVPPQPGEIRRLALLGNEVVYALDADDALRLYSLSPPSKAPRLVKEWR